MIVAPNPFSDFLKIENRTTRSWLWNLTDANGHTMLVGKLEPGMEKRIPTPFEAGTYCLYVADGNGTYAKMLIKIR